MDFGMTSMFRAFAFAAVLAIGAVSDVRAQSDMKLPGDTVRGAELAASCALCHGKNGMGYPEGIPRIVGQSAGYIRSQLFLFRNSARFRAGETNGTNGNTLAHLKSASRSFLGKDDLVLGLTDQDIADVAAYYKAQKCIPSSKPRPARPATASRCDVCHGQGGKKTTRSIPSLASQHAVYTSRQLKMFRATKTMEDVDLIGERVSRFNRVMHTQSRWLTQGLIKELSKYYESIPCNK